MRMRGTLQSGTGFNSGRLLDKFIQSLFKNGEQGAWYDPSYIISLFQDSAGTTPVTDPGQPVGRMLDRSGRNNHATQSTSTSRPIYQTSARRITIDRIDDRMLVTLPAITGTMIIATPEGTAAYGYSIAAGSYDIGGMGGLYFPGTAITGQVIRNGALTQNEIDRTIAQLRRTGGGLNYGTVTNFSNYWRNRTEITSFPAIDTSEATSVALAWYGCSGLTSFPLLDTSKATTVAQAWRGCSSMASFPLIDTSKVTNFDAAWQSCSSLTSFPLINTSLGTNFAAAWNSCSGLTSFPLIDTSKGTSFTSAWTSCSGLTSFPLLNTGAGTAFNNTWYGCSGLTSFPLIDTAKGTNFNTAWRGCSSLTSFPLLDTSLATNFTSAWRSCSSLTSFPLIDTSKVTTIANAWQFCSSLTSFPAISTPLVTTFQAAWNGCVLLTSFPLIDTSSGTNFNGTWNNCPALTTFPANAFDNIKGGDFTNAFLNTNLTQASIDGILVSLVTSGIATGTRVFNQSGGSAPSATGQAAITTLRSRGWTVTVTGGF